jgi:hypothetical protein
MWVKKNLCGPYVIDDHLVRRLQAEIPDNPFAPSKATALGRMKSARLKALRTLFSRQTHTTTATVATAGTGRKG